MKYFDEIQISMEWPARDLRTVFIGQAVEVPGTAMSNTVKDIPIGRRIELPVAEEFQMGMTIGLALQGQVSVSIYPRRNFLLLAANQLVNHLDKLGVMSNGGFQPRVIIRTSIGSQRPLHPQFQHIGDFTDAFRLMYTTIEAIGLDEPAQIVPAYKRAPLRDDGRSTLLVERGDFYVEK